MSHDELGRALRDRCRLRHPVRAGRGRAGRRRRGTWRARCTSTATACSSDSLDVGETSGVALPPDWALQVPHDYVEVLQVAVPAAVRRQRDRPARRHRHRHRLHRVHRAAGARRRHAAVRAAGTGRPPARLRQAVEAPRRAAPRRPDQHARRRARRAVAGAATAAGSRRSGSSPRGCSSWRRIRDIYRRTAHWIEAADWIVWQLTGVYVRNACTAGYKAIRQDGAYPSREFLAALNPEFADFVDDKVERPDRPARRSRRLADGGRRLAGPGSPKGSRSVPATSMPT